MTGIASSIHELDGLLYILFYHDPCLALPYTYMLGSLFFSEEGICLERPAETRYLLIYQTCDYEV